MIYDGCMVHSELDMLELRLTALSPVVDRFIVVESSLTHSGQPKPLYVTEALKAGRFDAYRDRLTVAVATDLGTGSSWEREYQQRAFIGDVLRLTAQPDDWVLIGDVDEIPTPDAIRTVVGQTQYDAAMLELALYYYTFACRVRQGWGIGMCRWHVEQEPNRIRRGVVHVPQLVVQNAGVHLSYFMTPEGVVEKLNAFMHHADVAKDVPRDAAWIAGRMAAEQDLFGRTVMLEHVTPNGDLPQPVRDDPATYRALGWLP